ncbi:MAG: hypothetical protein ABW123_04195, partial [Cystobacter sp.]
DPPQVTVRLDDSSVVGRSVKLSISLSGCDPVQKLEVFNDTTLVKQVPVTGNPTPVELTRSELRFGGRLAASLSLSARVTCADGRSNVSQGQLATFFPVEEVIEPAVANTQVVPNYFIAEGSGDDVAFIGCGMDGNRPYLYRVEKRNPTAPQRLEMDFNCNETTTITDRKPAGSGVRWVWTSGSGAMVIDRDFKRKAIDHEVFDNPFGLSVAADGNAFVYDGVSLQVLTPQGTVKWRRTLIGNELPGIPIGDPVLTSARKVVMPFQRNRTEVSEIMVGVMDYDLADPTGKPAVTYRIDDLNPMIDRSPWVAFNPAGTVLYLGTQQQNSVTVRACAVGQPNPCQAGHPASRLWINDTLPGYLAALIPYDDGRRLAVITTNRFWFLDATRGSANEGRALNKDQQPLTPSGALVGRFAQPGPGEAFYMFNSAPGTDQVPNPHAVELLAMDSAERGLVYRYQMPGGQTIYGALDDGGALWLRVGVKLARPFALAEYRQMP